MFIDNIKLNEGTSVSKKLNRLAEDSNPYHGMLDAVIIRKDGTKEYIKRSYNARVNAGAAYQAASTFTSLGSALFNYIALSSTSITPASGDTALSGEISGSGMSRVQVTPTYTAPSSVGGQFQIQFVHTFTATATVTVNSLGLLNASSSGTLYSEIAFSSTASLSSGDSLQVTYTINN